MTMPRPDRPFFGEDTDARDPDGLVRRLPVRPGRSAGSRMPDADPADRADAAGLLLRPEPQPVRVRRGLPAAAAGGEAGAGRGIVTERQEHILRVLADPCSCRFRIDLADIDAIQAALDEIGRLRGEVAELQRLLAAITRLSYETYDDGRLMT
jgi:hypothetical protein